MSFEELVERYKETAHSLSPKERAILEAKIWEETPASIRPTVMRREWLSKHLGVSHYISETSNRLRKVGDAANPLWDRIERGDLPLHTAGEILRLANSRVTDDVSLTEVINAFVSVYDSMEISKHTKDGLPIKGGLIQKLKEVTFTPERKTGKSGRDFWQTLRTLIRDYVSEHLSESDPILKDRVLAHLEVDLKVVIDEARARINSDKAKGTTFFVTRNKGYLEKVKESCRVLRVKFVDGKIDLVEAGKMKRRLARLYHPDLHNGSEAHREKYDQVLEAYKVLESYMETR